jgi:subtilase family protein
MGGTTIAAIRQGALIAAATATLVLVALVTASGANGGSPTKLAPASPVPYGERPLTLPGDGPRAAGAYARGWLIGARPGRAAAVVAGRFSARALSVPGAFSIPTGRARRFATALRRHGLLLYAEPDVSLRHASLVEGGQDGWARGVVVPLALAWPAPGVAVGIIDDFVDPTHPDVGPQTTYLNAPTTGAVALGPHGTQVASAAAAAQNGFGVLGVLPGAPLVSYGMPTEFNCGDVASGIEAQIAAGVKLINLSLGGTDCFTMFRSVQRAYAAGRLIVAAAGNEFETGNPVLFPAAYPHVLSVAAIRPDGRPAAFSSANLAVDIAAPGVAVPVATPGAFDTADGAQDGMTVADGTSFASPIVAGAASWVAAARADLSNGQLADVLRMSAVDLARPGYDSDTGFGLVNVPRALAAPTPRIDPLEPNDGITFVDGTAFGRRDAPVWRGFGRRTVRATADRAEDPVDVYRIRVPPRFAFRIRVRPTFGDPTLAVFGSHARSIAETSQIIARSSRRGGRTESVGLVNRDRFARAAYVMVAIPDSSAQLNASYRLEFQRARFPAGR